MTPRSPRAGEDADDLDVEEALALVNDAHTPGDRPSGDRTHGDRPSGDRTHGDDGTHGNGPHGIPVPGAPAHRDGADWT
ncbi:molybdopterin molybdenumtransferase MoeA, partial [Streptomyces sp. SID4956]|nr:molybdopterin molybdenumtransferase MoeA [Streptomyces sp. SID4956]